ncbi:hypothetical protein ACOMHN_021683 [Nucella lapillus]
MGDNEIDFCCPPDQQPHLLRYYKGLVSSSSVTSQESSSAMATAGGPPGGSAELVSYQDSLEGVLTWLLEAEEAMDRQPPIAEVVSGVKEQFNQHEEFMLELTQHQDSIGAVLRDGNELILEGRVTAEEEHEIRVQMGLLNNRWEELRVKALHRQSRLQQVLMALQQQQLDGLGAWLTGMEDRINRQEPVSADLDTIKRQVDQHKLIQQSLEAEQKRVDSLQHMVVVVDDSNADSGAACVAMEQQLERLGSRWSAVCRWTEDHWVVLQEVLLRLQQFHDEQTKFSVWMEQKEGVLLRMGQTDLSDPDQVIVQVRHLKAIENDMGEQVRRFDALNECGQHIVRYVDNQAAVSRIAALLETLQERWEKLVQMMELYSNQIANSGVELSKISQLYEAETDEDSTQNQASSSSSSSSFSSAKKRKVESAQRMEFEMELKKLIDWFGSPESTLQLLVAENSQEPFTVEEQRVLIQDTENSIRSHQMDMQRVVTLGKGVLTELKIAGESQEATQDSIQRVEERWERLSKVLADTQRQVERSFESKKFHSELGALLELVEGYDKWLGATQPVAEEAGHIRRQLDQCKVKLRAMQAHQDRVESLKLHGEHIVRHFRSTTTIKEDLQAFLTRWDKAFARLGDRRRLLVEALEKAPPRSFLEAVAVLLKWLEDMEGVLQAQRIPVGSLRTMHCKLDIYKELRRDLEDHSANQDYINRTGRELIARSPAERAATLEVDLSSLNTRWRTVWTTVEQRQVRLEKAISQMKEYRTQYEGLTKWMDEMEVFLHSQDPAAGDMSALKAQLQESQGVSDDIQTLKHNVESINSLASLSNDDSDPDYQNQMKEEVAALNQRWEGVVSMAGQQDERLKGRLSNTQGVYDRMQGLTSWLTGLRQDLANKDYSVYDPDDLQVKADKFKSLKNEVSEREGEVTQINEEVNGMLKVAGSGSGSGSQQELARALMKLMSLWEDVAQRIDRYAALYHRSQLQWKEFTNILAGEQDYLRILEQKVRQSSSMSSDAEDISEELNEMETVLQDLDQEAKQRAVEVGGELMANSVMPHLVQQQLDEFLHTSHSLEAEAKAKAKVTSLEVSVQHAQTVERQMLEMTQWMSEMGKGQGQGQNRQAKAKAKAKVTSLEVSVQQAQTVERQMLEMTQWMSEMGQHLQSRLDADLLAGDVPHEQETCWQEMAGDVPHEQEVGDRREREWGGGESGEGGGRESGREGGRKEGGREGGKEGDTCQSRLNADLLAGDVPHEQEVGDRRGRGGRGEGEWRGGWKEGGKEGEKEGDTCQSRLNADLLAGDVPHEQEEKCPRNRRWVTGEGEGGGGRGGWKEGGREGGREGEKEGDTCQSRLNTDLLAGEVPKEQEVGDKRGRGGRGEGWVEGRREGGREGGREGEKEGDTCQSRLNTDLLAGDVPHEQEVGDRRGRGGRGGGVGGRKEGGREGGREGEKEGDTCQSRLNTDLLAGDVPHEQEEKCPRNRRQGEKREGRKEGEESGRREEGGKREGKVGREEGGRGEESEGRKERRVKEGRRGGKREGKEGGRKEGEERRMKEGRRGGKREGKEGGRKEGGERRVKEGRRGGKREEREEGRKEGGERRVKEGRRGGKREG